MIPAKKRMEVLKLYFEGLSYDEISKAARISKGSVVNIVRELMRGSIPNFWISRTSLRSCGAWLLK